MIAGLKAQANEVFDVLTNAQVLRVHPMTLTEGFQRESCTATVQDDYDGRTVNVAGLNKVAREVQKLVPGEIIHAIGTLRRFNGSPQFFVQRFLTDEPVILNGTVQAKQLVDGPTADPAPVEAEDFGAVPSVSAREL
jgi:hypothetical protein